MANTINRRLVITVGKDEEYPFLVETMWQTPAGYWNVLSRTSVRRFPWLAVERVAGRADYAILVHVYEPKE